MKNAHRNGGQVSGRAGVTGVVPALVLMALVATGAPAPGPPDAERTKPLFTWGADLRMRQEYVDDIDLDRHAPDTRNVLRTRYRVWTTFGPFLRDDTLKDANGLSFTARLTYEPRYFFEYQPAASEPPRPDWNEVVADSLYADWTRVGGLPVSVRLGRQDLNYGRNFIFGEGTPLDGSRTQYFDACKTTLHLDAIKSQVDLLCIGNRGDESDRLRPWNWHEVQKPVSEHDVNAHGVYLTSRYFKDQELGAYYLRKHDEPIPAYAAKGFGENTLHTAGIMVQGKTGPWDYYAEAAAQRGRYDGERHRAEALSTDLGYTFKRAVWTPRVHAEYEYLSGDDPHTSTHEGWDPVFSRWPRWSEAFSSRFSKEYGRAGYWTNLQRLTLGVRAQPAKGLTLSLDGSYLRANEHDHGTAPPYGPGLTRGCLVVPRIIYDLNRHTQMHLWAEYFRPGSYYARDSDPALFLRWQIVLTF